jgi:hypothetical protein
MPAKFALAVANDGFPYLESGTPQLFPSFFRGAVRESAGFGLRPFTAAL